MSSLGRGRGQTHSNHCTSWPNTARHQPGGCDNNVKGRVPGTNQLRGVSGAYQSVRQGPQRQAVHAVAPSPLHSPGTTHGESLWLEGIAMAIQAN